MLPCAASTTAILATHLMENLLRAWHSEKISPFVHQPAQDSERHRLRRFISTPHLLMWWAV